jgi:hypothetical protein
MLRIGLLPALGLLELVPTDAIVAIPPYPGQTIPRRDEIALGPTVKMRMNASNSP